MNLLTIFGTIIAAVCFILLAAFLVVFFHYFVFFRWRSCKHCHQTMDYRGGKGDNDDEYYLFHCPKCGAWEKVPKEEFYRQCEKEPYE